MQQTIEEFIKMLREVNKCTQAELLLLYDTKFTLTFGDNKVEIPFDAVSYNALVSALETIKELS